MAIFEVGGIIMGKKYEGGTDIGGWIIPDEDLEKYVTTRNELMLFLEKELANRFAEIEFGGEGSEDGDYVSAHNQSGWGVFVHFDPQEVDRFSSFENKEDYIQEVLFFAEEDYKYYQLPGKLELEGQKGSDDWYDYMSAAYKKRFNKEYPFERLVY